MFQVRWPLISWAERSGLLVVRVPPVTQWPPYQTSGRGPPTAPKGFPIDAAHASGGSVACRPGTATAGDDSQPAPCPKQ